LSTPSPWPTAKEAHLGDPRAQTCGATCVAFDYVMSKIRLHGKWPRCHPRMGLRHEAMIDHYTTHAGAPPPVRGGSAISPGLRRCGATVHRSTGGPQPHQSLQRIPRRRFQPLQVRAERRQPKHKKLDAAEVLATPEDAPPIGQPASTKQKAGSSTWCHCRRPDARSRLLIRQDQSAASLSFLRGACLDLYARRLGRETPVPAS